jgi:hypothetical protein
MVEPCGPGGYPPGEEDAVGFGGQVHGGAEILHHELQDDHGSGNRTALHMMYEARKRARP